MQVSATYVGSLQVVQVAEIPKIAVLLQPQCEKYG